MISPPDPPKKPVELTRHGHSRTDEYFWMNQRDEKEVVQHLEAENAYLDKRMQPVAGLQDAIYKEFLSRIPPEDASVPFFDNGYWYYMRFAKDGEYPIICRKPGTLDNDEQIILDVNALAGNRKYCEVGSYSVSFDNEWLAFATDFEGRRKYTIRFKNLATGEISGHEIPDTAGELEWAGDNNTLYYISIDEETLRNDKLYAIKRDDPASKSLLWHEHDDRFDLSLDLSKSKKYLLVSSESKTVTEVRYLDIQRQPGTLKTFHHRENDRLYTVDHLNGQFFIISNKYGLNFEMLTTSENDTAASSWQRIVPHRREVLIEDAELFDDFLVTEERTGGLVSLVVRQINGEVDHSISFDDPAYLATIHTNPNAGTSWLRYQFSSLTTPKTIVDYNMETKERVVKKVQEIPGGYDATEYTSQRLWATAHDMVKVPISLVRRRDTPVDGTAPMLLYGYGSYGISSDATFSQARLSLLDRGFIFAIAHTRGGEEMGRSWYEEEGKLLHKMNTFHDFISCARHLLKKKLTAPDRLFAMGGSAGGLLIGAVMNMRPDLFRGMVAIVPFVDVLTTMLDASIPLTTQEYDEWGDPNDETFYRYIHQYSPYDNVKDRKYPATLVSTGYHDSQVQYWEPAKWVARLRAHQQGDDPILFHINMDAGHGGASGRYQQYKEVAMYYAFIVGVAQGKI